MVKFGQTSPPSQALAISLFPQYARTQNAPEAMVKFSSHEQMQEQMPFPKEAKGNSQDSGYSTTTEAMVKFGQTIPPSPALATSLFLQDAKTQDAPDAMVKFSSHEQMQEQMTLPKEAHGNSQESRYNTAPEAMVKSGQTSPPPQALATSLFPQDAKTRDAPEAMVKFSSHEQVQEQMKLPKEAHAIFQEQSYNTAPEAMVKSGKTSPPSQSLATSPFTQDSRNQDASEAMPKSEGSTSMAEPLWNILQNKAAKVVDHESNTMQDSNTIMQQEVWEKDNDCETSASQLSKYGANNLLLPPLAEPLQRPYTPVRVSEPMDEAPETPKTGNECHSTSGQ
jgi:hypothetical protein